jgi:hypothetical protein
VTVDTDWTVAFPQVLTVTGVRVARSTYRLRRRRRRWRLARLVHAVAATALTVIGARGLVAIRYARADSALARAGTALTDVLTALADALTARRVGSSLTDAEGGQRAPYEGCSHQLERLSARDAAASQCSSQIVEGAVGSLLAHLLPPSLKGGTLGD